MTREIVVESAPEETRVAVLEGGRVAELHVERAGERSLIGNVYLARVDRVIPGMQSAFVDIGHERHAFLHASDVAPLQERESDAVEGEKLPVVEAPIESLLRQGQDVVVQVTREPIGTKGARVTTHVTLPGKRVVYMPLSDHLGISKRITDEKQRDELRRTLLDIRSRIEGGVIVRTDALGAAPEQIEAEMAHLRQEWTSVQSRIAGAAPPVLLREDEGVALRVLRDSQAADIERVVVDDPALFARLLSWMQAHVPSAAGRLSLHGGATGLFESLGLEQELDKAVRDRAWLKSGGYLVINQLEALVAVDVNTGKFTGGKRLEDTVLQVNLEAAREVARQLRLRDLGGIVVVDFIDMTEAPHRQAVLRELENALARDRARTTVLGMSEFGLVQLTRQRQKRSLDRVLLTACPDCHGSGRVKSADTLAHAVLRRVRRQPAPRLSVRLHPEIAGVLRQKLQLLEQQGRPLGCDLTLVEDASVSRDAFELTA